MSDMNLRVFGGETSTPLLPSTKTRPRTKSDSVIESSNEKEEMMSSVSLVQWAVCGPHTYKPVSSTFPKLTSGVYSVAVSQYHGIIYQKKIICVDDLLRFPDSVSDKILNEITTFWDRGDKFKEHGFLHRRGYLLHGPAGCHAKGTKVIMFDGSFKNVEDVKMGDLLMGPDSKSRFVYETLCGNEEMFRITPVKGEPFIVNKNHILHLIPSCKNDTFRFPLNIKVSDYLTLTECAKEGFKLTYVNGLRTGFTIESIGEADYYGFNLNGDHLYLTSDFIIHHNSGKTCLVQQIIADIVAADGLVFQCTNHPTIFNDGLSQFRKVEPNRPVVALYEDIDAIIEEHGEDEILALLDGESQIDRVLNIATTNYPEKLDKRLVCRPRRFDRVIEIGMPSAIVRKMYFEKKLNVTGTELDKWVVASEGFSFAACAELVISVCCFGNEFNNVISGLKEMMSANISSRDYNYDSKNVGFSAKKS